VGDSIRIRRPATAQWLQFMDMDRLVRDGQPQTWIGTDAPIEVERTVGGLLPSARRKDRVPQPRHRWLVSGLKLTFIVIHG